MRTTQPARTPRVPRANLCSERIKVPCSKGCVGAANQSSGGKIPDGVTALNFTFQESAVKGCWCETYWLKEVFPEATAARESAHSELIKKMNTQAEAETDEKKKKALLAKLANITSPTPTAR